MTGEPNPAAPVEIRTSLTEWPTWVLVGACWPSAALGLAAWKPISCSIVRCGLHEIALVHAHLPAEGRDEVVVVARDLDHGKPVSDGVTLLTLVHLLQNATPAEVAEIARRT